MSDSFSWIFSLLLTVVLTIAAPGEGLAQRAAVAPARLPPYERPPEVIDRCAAVVTNRAAQRFLADTEDGGRSNHFLGGGALGRGPTRSDERQVFLYLPSREVRVDAETGECTQVQDGTTLEGAIKGALEQLLRAYRARVSSILEGEGSSVESDRIAARASRARLTEFRAYLERALRTCIGDNNSRVVPSSIQEIVRPIRIAVREENLRLGAAPPTRN